MLSDWQGRDSREQGCSVLIDNTMRRVRMHVFPATSLHAAGRLFVGYPEGVCRLAVSIDGSVLEHRRTCQTSVVHCTGSVAQGTTLSPPKRNSPED